jgi:hypothetical protein
MRPYINIEENNNHIIRKFSNDIDISELKWHIDKETRVVEPLIENNWKIQLDNELPIILNKSIFIPVNKWHRLIKGDGNLIVKIYKIYE